MWIVWILSGKVTFDMQAQTQEQVYLYIHRRDEVEL